LGFTLKERKKNAEIRELMVWESVNLLIKNIRLTWFGYVGHWL